jgi:hypothetical protein
MSDNDWMGVILIAAGVVFIVMRRLHRLGAQLEAVCQVIQLEVAGPERQRELLQHWRAARDQASYFTSNSLNIIAIV